MIKNTEERKKSKIEEIKRMTDSEIYFFSKRYISDFYKNKESDFFDNIFIDLISLSESGNIFSRFLIRVFDNSRVVYERKISLINLSFNEDINRRQSKD